MARPKKVEEDSGDISGEYKRPDAALAFQIYDDELKKKKAHIATIKGDMSEPHKRIKDEANFPRKVLDFIVTLDEMEDAKRDHWLLALSSGLAHRKLYLPRDLATMAEGKDGDEIVPTGERERMKLATVDGKEAFEASEEEIAQQKGRPSAEKAKAQAEAEAEQVDA